jgi:hypothetical protein
VTDRFLQKLDRWGIQPYCVVFDLWTTFPKVVRRIWPEVLFQYDYFHIMQRIWYYLRNALIQFRKSLKGERWALYREEIWERRWSLLKQMDRWTPKEHRLLPEMIEMYRDTPVEKVLLFEEAVWDLFELSPTKAEVLAKRDALVRNPWWKDSWHLRKCIEFLQGGRFDLMFTYLEDPRVPRSGQSETLVNVWRQMEAVRRGFKTQQGRLNHLKLFQVTHYLRRPL